MTTRAVPEMRDWATRPFDGGFDGLHDLAGREFTGGVEADAAVLFMLRGRVVGVFRIDDEADEGLRPTDIEPFEDATGTAYEAPHPALPLLFAMRATGGEERGRYYTEDTPIEEVHERLSGGFTGYLELSENVLSGDYYLVYHGGRSKQVAFVGQSGRLLEDEEAFERACGEVGIYTVTAVALEPLDIPGEPDRSGGAAEAGGAAGVGAGAGAGAGTANDAGSGDGVDEDGIGSTADAVGTTDDGSGSAADATGAVTADSGPTAPDDPDTDSDGDGADETDFGVGSGIDLGGSPGDEPSDTGEPSGDGEAADESHDLMADIPTTEATSTSGETDIGDGPEPRDPATDGQVRTAVTAVEDADIDDTDIEEADDDPAADTDSASGGGMEATAGAAASGATDEEVAALRDELAAREEEVSELEREVEALESETEALERELQSVRDERDDLAARVEDLEGRLRELGSGDAAPEEGLDRATALSGTSLFVRYRSKSDPTLDALADGASREEIVDNLQLERHTEFDAGTVAVEGRTFGTFLEDTQEYRFARWLMTELPLEIRDTGSRAALGELYEALPEIDRISFGEPVELNGEEREFDLVARDRMGNPLVVATLDESRDPTDEGRLAELVQDATALAQEHASLAGGIAVTAAYFEPEALSTAEEATGGSLLSRDKRESFVKLSRNRGYHLCLVEDREDSFYLSVPEL
jgi:hypothetical protein